MDVYSIILPILLTAILVAGWGAIQFLAKKMGTKNHIDNAGSCGNGCMCQGGGECQTKKD